MGERSDYASGTFCFADVGTTDRPRAAEFYGELFGWKADPTMGEYTMFTLEERPVAGLFEAPEGYSPAWLSYISVADADARRRRSAKAAARCCSDRVRCPTRSGARR